MSRNFMEMLRARWAQNKFVCVGLDSEAEKIPQHIRYMAGAGYICDAIIAFNRAIVEATCEFACAFKPNIAFYEALGDVGWTALHSTTIDILQIAPDVPVILDGKRADIGNTNNGYVKAAFSFFKADAITVHPYLGAEALKPFLDLPDKGVIVLCRTSNPGAGEFQDLEVKLGDSSQGPILQPLYQFVAKRVATEWNKNGNCGVVVGATYPHELRWVRDIVGDMPILIPGVGFQQNDVPLEKQVEQVVTAGKDSRGQGMIINSSRGIIFASDGPDFAQAARRETQKLHDLINQYR